MCRYLARQAWRGRGPRLTCFQATGVAGRNPDNGGCDAESKGRLKLWGGRALRAQAGGLSAQGWRARRRRRRAAWPCRGGESPIRVNPAVNPTLKPTAVGRWQTIDDKTGKPRAIVRIYQSGNTYQADIEQVFYAPGEEERPVRAMPEPQRGEAYAGPDHPVGAQADGSGRGYADGRILDPANATVYKCKMWLDESGEVLDVRGLRRPDRRAGPHAALAPGVVRRHVP